MIEDFAFIARNMRPDEIEQHLAMTGLDEYRPDIAARGMLGAGGTSYVMVDEGNKPVLVGGMSPVRPGVWQAWLAGTEAGWAAHWRVFTTFCRGQVDAMLADGAHRVEVAALASRTAAHDWYVRGLGMAREGVLKGYCANGADAVMFAKTRATG